jgi:flavin reductase (DIM6/NTAB) family NADH-FMN oxidoreductase RutF
MATSSGVPHGRVPEGEDSDAYDRRRRRVLWTLPYGLYLLGSRGGGRRNLMTVNWVTQVAMQPKLLAVGVERHALTNALVREGRAFSLSVLRREDRAVVRRFVKPADDDPSAGTLAGHPVISATTGAPILAAAAAWIDCELRQTLDFESHTLFVGEVVDCGFPGAEDGEVLRMEDTRLSYGG